MRNLIDADLPGPGTEIKNGTGADSTGPGSIADILAISAGGQRILGIYSPYGCMKYIDS